MQTYAIRMFNFLRFGEKDNSIVFDLTQQQKDKLKNGSLSMDQIYDEVLLNPIQHIESVKARGLERLLGITGLVNGNTDFSNGAGKSTLMEGICYSRYERIVRKTAQNPHKVEKAGLSVVTKFDGKYPPTLKQSWVEEICEINGRIYRIKRGREFSKNHKSSTPIMELECISDKGIDSKNSHRSPDTKENLSDILTMDYDLFVNSQMFGQNDAGKYLNGTDKTKKEMLISLLHLENIVSGCLENVRKKKNIQEKKISGIRTNIDLIEKSFCKKMQEITSKFVELFEDKIIDDILLSFNQSKHNSQNSAKECSRKIKEIDEKVTELGKSDKLQKVEAIREEGRRCSKDKKDKEQLMSSQVSEWVKLMSESRLQSDSKDTQINGLKIKVERLQNNKEQCVGFVEKFDLDRHEEQLLKVDKAKKIKPEIEKNLSDARQIYGEHSNKLAIVRSQNKIHMSDLEQLNKYGDKSDFICPECKSKVTKDHVLSAISSIRETIENNNLEIKTLEESLNNDNSSIRDLESKRTRINDLLISEANITSSIKSFNDTKSKIVELDQFIKDNEESIKIAVMEKCELSKKVVLYETKIQEIKKSFEADMREIKEKIEELSKKFKMAENDAKVITEQIENLKNEKKDIERQKNKYIETYGSICKDYEHYEAKKIELNTFKKEYESESKSLNRILLLEDVYGLDGIQTRIIRKYLPLLNIYIKEFLDILSDGEMSVKMIINDKSEVDMLITGGSADTYEMLSGGEKMIVRLSVDIGLSLFTFSRTKHKPEMICLDEIFAPLDNFHTEKVFKILQKLQDKFSRILIITHKPEINSRILNHIYIEKTGGKMGLSKIKRID